MQCHGSSALRSSICPAACPGWPLPPEHPGASGSCHELQVSWGPQGHQSRGTGVLALPLWHCWLGKGKCRCQQQPHSEGRLWCLCLIPLVPSTGATSSGVARSHPSVGSLFLLSQHKVSLPHGCGSKWSHTGCLKVSSHRAMTQEHITLSNTSVGQKSPGHSLSCTAAPQKHQFTGQAPSTHCL